MPDLKDALDALNDTFGFDSFREGQEAVISRLLAGKSVLAIFPTGAGKSLCYQLPALLLDGVTLVISPLIALMKDQIDFLVSKGVQAARLDSSLDAAGAREVYQKLRNGTLKILYVAPERLANERFLATLSRMRIALLAVDEAHCISEWGHNFRPDYLKLAPLAKRLKVGRVLALTATATPPVATQIAGAFEIADSDVVRTGFYRPNLNLMVTPACGSARERLLIERIRKRPTGPTIVYVTLQRTAESVSASLRGAGISASAYHAGMDPEDRHHVQDAFMQSDDKVVVATIAFGMGIDKSNIRAVYHFNLPKSLENYAQEIGRAGRDGEPSVCELFACADDRVTLENFTFGDTPTREAIDGMLREVLSQGEQFDISVYDLSASHDIRPLVVETLLTYLQLDGYLLSTGPFYSGYKFKPQRSMEAILAGFDQERRDFLASVFSHARMGKSWSSIDLHETAAALGEPRQRVVAAINYLEEQGDLILQVTGVRHGYRLLKRPADLAALSDSMAKRFLEREKRDMERLNQVMDFASGDGCRTRMLLAYFGEPADQDCGHCAWCRGHRPGAVPAPSHRPPGAQERRLIADLRAEGYEALQSSRQLARFLCGIPSPSASKAKLTRDPRFGALIEVPFQQVLKLLE
jgi:ATP-dependent DNA helicase RecQ